MSDPNAPGEPVEPAEESASVEDVVGQAHAGLADAEAAGRDAVGASAEPADASADPASVETSAQTSVEPPAEAEAPAAEPVAETPAEPAATAADVPWYERDDVPLDDARTAAASTTVMEPAVTQSAYGNDQPTENLATPAVVPLHTPQPIFVQAPEPPRPRGNRGAAGAIGLLAALSFAVLYLGVWIGAGFVDGSVTGANAGEKIVAHLATWELWIPVAVFFIAFWLLGAIVNRGRWGLWVVFGLLVGVAAYGGHLLGQLVQAPFWNITASRGEEIVKGQLLVPLAIAAFVIGRELTVWFGAWVAARGKRVTELNYEAQREYERTLEAGPTIVPTVQG